MSAVGIGLVLAIVLAVIGAGFWLHRGGRRAAEGDAAKASNEVKDEQLDIAVNAPRTAKEVAARIRERGGF